jgi:hypothetical protein
VRKDKLVKGIHERKRGNCFNAKERKEGSGIEMTVRRTIEGTGEGEKGGK